MFLCRFLVFSFYLLGLGFLCCGGKSGGGDYRKRSRPVECAIVESSVESADRE